MATFPDWFADKMLALGYTRTYTHENIESIWMSFLSREDKEGFHLMYLRAPMSPEAIRQTFSSHNEPVLFIVEFDCIFPFGTANAPLWVKALHAIYYGRIYVWGGNGIIARHYDWTNQETISSSPLELDGILFTDTDCKLRDFPGVFHIARFYDKAFWKEQPEQPKAPPKRKKRQPNPDEYFWREEWARQNNTPPKQETEEDILKAFKRYYEEAMRQRQAREQRAYSQRPNRYTPTDDKWLQEFIATGSIEAAKTLYRQLGKEWHPDLNPGKPQAHETMQLINIAYAKVKDILR